MLPKFSSASKGETNNTQGNRSCKKKKETVTKVSTYMVAVFCNSLTAIFYC